MCDRHQHWQSRFTTFAPQALPSKHKLGIFHMIHRPCNMAFDYPSTVLGSAPEDQTDNDMTLTHLLHCSVSATPATHVAKQLLYIYLATFS